MSSRAPEPVGPYAYTRRAGGLLFVSGLGPRVRGSAEVPGVILDAAGEVMSYDFESQCRQVLENVRVVLQEAGSSMDKVVDVTVFLTNLKQDFQAMNRIYGQAFSANPPTRTTVEVTRLPTPIAIELKVIAAL